MVESDPVDRALQLGRSALSPPTAAKGRHRAALFGSLPPPAPVDVPAGAGSGPFAAVRRSVTASAAVGMALLGAGIAIGFWLRGAVDSSEPPRPAAGLHADHGAATAPVSPQGAESLRSPDPADAPPAGAAAGGDAPPAGAAAGTDGAAPGALAKREPGARTGDTARRAAAAADEVAPRAPAARSRTPLQEELDLLQRVERAIRANNPEFALALLDELDARFPETRLREERSAARLLADCRLGRPGAPQRAEKFIAERPKSVYSERLQLACGATGGRATSD